MNLFLPDDEFDDEFVAHFTETLWLAFQYLVCNAYKMKQIFHLAKIET